jgi:hypothetical protein
MSHGSAMSFSPLAPVLAQRGEQRRVGIEAGGPAPEAGREIEAEAVHPRLANPLRSASIASRTTGARSSAKVLPQPLSSM